jgi:hypothetical protein
VSKSDQHELDLLKLYFTNIAAAGIGDAGGLQPSAAPGSIFVSLHTGDPGEAGTQATNEVTYPGYGRQATPRSAAGWTVSGTAPAQSANAALVSFPAAGSMSPQTATHFGVGDAVSGATKLRYSGALAVPLVINQLTQPQFQSGTLVVTED